jgi:hypothetical protein
MVTLSPDQAGETRRGAGTASRRARHHVAWAVLALALAGMGGGCQSHDADAGSPALASPPVALAASPSPAPTLSPADPSLIPPGTADSENPAQLPEDPALPAENPAQLPEDPAQPAEDPSDDSQHREAVAAATNEWIACAQNHGFPALQEVSAQADRSQGIAVELPWSTTPDEWHALFDACPNFDISAAQRAYYPEPGATPERYAGPVISLEGPPRLEGTFGALTEDESQHLADFNEILQSGATAFFTAQIQAGKGPGLGNGG